MKKTLCCLLALFIALSACTAFAAEREDWLSTSQYYYAQLSPEHKLAWEDDIANVLNFPYSMRYTRARQHQALGPMIKLDNPRIFWIDWIDSDAVLRFDTGSEPSYHITAFPRDISVLQSEFLAGIDVAVAQIRSDLPQGASEQDTILAIHNWLCKNNTYNKAQTSDHKKENDPVSFDYLAAHSAYSAIIPGDEYEPVCEGYAGAFQILCEEFGIPCICVSGTASFGGHDWNMVYVDGGWYIVDVTSDDSTNSRTYYMLGSKKAAKYKFTPDPYVGSGVNPSNGYTEGAAFTVPELAK